MIKWTSKMRFFFWEASGSILIPNAPIDRLILFHQVLDFESFLKMFKKVTKALVNQASTSSSWRQISNQTPFQFFSKRGFSSHGDPRVSHYNESSKFFFKQKNASKQCGFCKIAI